MGSASKKVDGSDPAWRRPASAKSTATLESGLGSETEVTVTVLGSYSKNKKGGLECLVQFGRYEILGRLARGGMAEIYLARERSTAGGTRHLAVKVIRSEYEDNEEFGNLFLQEGKLALRLQHPSICHVYEFGVQDGHYFIAMELVAGVSLHALMRKALENQQRIPVDVVVKVISKVAEALHAAHGAKDSEGRPLRPVHQDVSPQNIMVGYDGNVKLLDFGVAATKEEASSATGEASQPSGSIRGKFAYMSPQQAMGGNVDARSDLFSLGICLYEALALRRVFRRPTEFETLQAVSAAEIPTPDEFGIELDPVLWGIVQKALERSLEKRYQTGEDMHMELEGFLAASRRVVTAAQIGAFMRDLLGAQTMLGPEVDARPEVVAWLMPPEDDPDPEIEVVETQPDRRPKRAIAVGAALVGVLGLGALGWVVLGGQPESQPPAEVAEEASAPPEESVEVAVEEAEEAEVPAVPIEVGDLPPEESAEPEPPAVEVVEAPVAPSEESAAASQADASSSRRSRRRGTTRGRRDEASSGSSRRRGFARDLDF